MLMFHVSRTLYRWGTVGATVIWTSACFDTVIKPPSVFDAGGQVVTDDAGEETKLSVSTHTQASRATEGSATSEPVSPGANSSDRTASDADRTASGDSSSGAPPLEAGLGGTSEASDVETSLDVNASVNASVDASVDAQTPPNAAASDAEASLDASGCDGGMDHGSDASDARASTLAEHICDGRTCADGRCVAMDACCDEDCGEHETCDGFSCVCDVGYGLCGAACIPEGECCDDSDCGNEATCTGGVCGCGSVSQRCESGTRYQCVMGQWQVEEACSGATPICQEVGESAACVCEQVTWYLDADGDGVGGDADTRSACSAEPPTSNHVRMNGDCCDSGEGAERVYPGQTKFSAAPAEGCLLQFDFDCDGEETRDTSSPFHATDVCIYEASSCRFETTSGNATPCGGQTSIGFCYWIGGRCSASFSLSEDYRACR